MVCTHTTRRPSGATIATPATASLRHLTAKLLILATLFFSTATCIPTKRADGDCVSPQGTIKLGEQVSLKWLPTGASRPATVTFTVACLVGNKQIQRLPSVSSDDVWIVPQNLLGACTNNQAYAMFTSQDFEVRCNTLTFLDPSAMLTTTTTTATTTIVATTTAAPTTTNILTTSALPVTSITSTTTSTSPDPTSTELNSPSGTPDVNVTAAVSGTVTSVTFVGIIVFVIITRRKRRRLSYEKQRLIEQSVTKTGMESGASTGIERRSRGRGGAKSGRAKSPDSYKCDMYEPPNIRTHDGKMSKPYSNSRTDGGVALKELPSIPITPNSGFVPISPISTLRNPQVMDRSQPRDRGQYAGLRNAEQSTDALYVQSVTDRVLALTTPASAPGNPHIIPENPHIIPGNPHIIPGNPQAIDHSTHPNEQECYTDIWNAEQYTDTLAPTSAADFVMKPTSAPGNPHVISRNPQALERSSQPDDQDASYLAASSATAFALAILTEPATASGNPHAIDDRLT